VTPTIQPDAASRASRPAKVLTEVFSPYVIVLALPFPVAFHATSGVGAAVLWALVTGSCGSLIPMGFIFRAMKRGQVTDHHVGVREQRLVPLAVCILSVVAGIGVLIALGAPKPMVALSAAEFAGLAVTLPLTHWWKVSVHAMVAAGGAVILAVTFGPALLALAVVVAAICWSRVQLRDHTPPQVVVGAALGATIAGAVFALLR
jgi:membrane-associated phospholipid phosphatase